MTIQTFTLCRNHSSATLDLLDKLRWIDTASEGVIVFKHALQPAEMTLLA
jgi:hypothetical protein